MTDKGRLCEGSDSQNMSTEEGPPRDHVDQHLSNIPLTGTVRHPSGLITTDKSTFYEILILANSERSAESEAALDKMFAADANGNLAIFASQQSESHKKQIQKSLKEQYGLQERDTELGLIKDCFAIAAMKIFAQDFAFMQKHLKAIGYLQGFMEPTELTSENITKACELKVQSDDVVAARRYLLEDCESGRLASSGKLALKAIERKTEMSLEKEESCREKGTEATEARCKITNINNVEYDVTWEENGKATVYRRKESLLLDGLFQSII